MLRRNISFKRLGPDELKALAEKQALEAFRTAAEKIPAYREFLKQKNVSPASVRTIRDFVKSVPVIDKDNTFRLYSREIKKLCLLGEIKDVRTIVASSGHSGCFSYGLNTEKELQRSRLALDSVLDSVFDASSKKTLLVNCLPMGIRIHSSLVTVVDTGVRADTAIGIVETFAACYDQTILVGENSFIKKVLEDGLREGLDWKRIKIHLVLGEEILPENLRSYFAGILGVSADAPDSRKLIGSSFGIAEFGLNVFYETQELIRIRRLLQRDGKLKEALIGRDLDNLPALVRYNPLRVYVEELPKQGGLADILLTNLEKDACIPLVRYDIGDEGILIPSGHLTDTLVSFGYRNYVPGVGTPLVAIWGREKISLQEGGTLRPEFVKEILFREHEIASGLTGNFRLSTARAGLRIEIQAKEEVGRNEAFENKLRVLLLSSIPAKTEIVIYPYRDFPYGMGLDYERKFRYI